MVQGGNWPPQNFPAGRPLFKITPIKPHTVCTKKMTYNKDWPTEDLAMLCQLKTGQDQDIV